MAGRLSKLAAGKFWLGLALCLACGSSARANMAIVFNADATVSADALAAANAAAQVWDSLFSNSITVNVNLSFSSTLGGSILGSTSLTEESISYSSVKSALAADSSQPGKAILASLPGSLTAVIPSGDSLSTNLAVTSANAKALGLDTLHPADDGSITFNSTFSWYYGTDGQTTSGYYDFESVVLHELGHVLGFVSSEDNSGTTVHATTLDLFRFADDSADGSCIPTSSTEFTSCKRYLTAGSTAQFLSDGTVLDTYGVSTATTYQASHWLQQSPAIGVMQPALGTGTSQGATAADIWAFEMIGYDSAVPEPGTVALMAAGMIGLAAFRRRRALPRS